MWTDVGVLRQVLKQHYRPSIVGQEGWGEEGEIPGITAEASWRRWFQMSRRKVDDLS